MDRVVARRITERDEWNSLVTSLPNHDLRQGFEWGKLRSVHGWSPERVAVFEGANCVGAVSLLRKTLPVASWSILHAPGGPLVLDHKHDPAVACLLAETRAVAEECGAIFARFCPPVRDEDGSFRDVLLNHGALHLPEDWTAWNSPRIMMTTDVRASEEILRGRVRRRYREYISAAPRRGLVVRAAVSLDEAHRFHASLVTAGRRKKFPVRNRAYFERLWQEYVEPGRGVLLMCEHEGRLVGGLLGARFGDKAYMLSLSLSPRHRTSDATVSHGPLLYWEFIRWAKRAGCTDIDWGGTGTHLPPREDDPGFGLYRFKLGFNASIEYRSGYYDLVFAPRRYAAFRFLERNLSNTAWGVRSRLNRRS